MRKKTLLAILITSILILGFAVCTKALIANAVASQYLINVCKNNKWGFINKEGKQIIPFKYDLPSNFSEGLAAACINEKCGYIDKTGKEIIPLKYNAAYSFSDGLAPVEINEKWGFINKSNNIVIPLEYISTESYTEGLAPVCKDFENCGYVNKKNEIKIQFKYTDVSSFKNGYAAVRAAKLWGLINKDGKEIIPLKYAAFDLPKEGLLAGCLQEDNGDGYKCGFTDINDKVSIPFNYIWNYGFTEGFAPVQGANENWFFINKKGEKAFQKEYILVGEYSEGLASVCKTIGKCGFIDKTGKEVIELKYEAVSSFSNGVAAVLVKDKNEKWGFINKNGQLIIAPQYDWTGLIF